MTQEQVDKADPQKSPDTVKGQTETKKAPAKKAAAKKTASKRTAAKKASSTVSPQKKAAKSAESGSKSSKASKVDDRPVTRSGLTSVPHDVLNPAFAAPEE